MVNPDTHVAGPNALLVALRRFWQLIVVSSVLGAGGALAVSFATPPVYESTASLYFALNQGGNAVDLNQGSTYTQNQMLSFAQLATSSRVLQPVIDDLELNTSPRQLARSLQVSIPQSTVVLEIRASSLDPRDAARLANAVTSSLVEVVRDVAPTGSDSAPTVKAEVIDRAPIPRLQSLPNKPLDVALGLVVGLFAGVLIAFAATTLDTRLGSPESLAALTGKPVLGSISRRSSRTPAVDQDPLAQTAEEFRRLRSALAYASLDRRLHRLLVTSSLPGDGKTTVAINLAVAFADAGDAALLVDGDLRRPRVAAYLGVEGAVGLTTVLLGEVALHEARLPWRTQRLSVLPSGTTPPNPAEVVTSASMRSLLGGAELEEYGVVVLDSPPVLSVADASLFAPMVDGVLVVVDARRTRRQQAVNSVRELEASGANVVGIVINNARTSGGPGRYYREAVEHRESLPS
ncbi:MAG: polysaccharide biosynthesis tyrosine autokinase [Micrococcales bacterium]|nr:polysaccharide biosynthesis tyrosine autokinase [Micrococcales bacterium]